MSKRVKFDPKSMWGLNKPSIKWQKCQKAKETKGKKGMTEGVLTDKEVRYRQIQKVVITLPPQTLVHFESEHDQRVAQNGHDHHSHHHHRENGKNRSRIRQGTLHSRPAIVKVTPACVGLAALLHSLPSFQSSSEVTVRRQQVHCCPPAAHPQVRPSCVECVKTSPSSRAKSGRRPRPTRQPEDGYSGPCGRSGVIRRIRQGVSTK